MQVSVLAGWQLVPVLAGWLQVPDEIHSQLAAVWVQGLEDFGTCDNDIAVIFTMLDADGDGQVQCTMADSATAAQ